MLPVEALRLVCVLFNSSFHEGVVPCWRVGEIVPLLKARNKLESTGFLPARVLDELFEEVVGSDACK